MARSGFTTTAYLEISSSIITAAPLTMACWAKTPTGAANQQLMVLGRSTVDTDNFVLRITGSTNVVTMGTTRSTAVFADTTAAITSNTWFHAAGVEVSATDRRAFLNGGNKGTNTTSRVPTSLNRTALGVYSGSVHSGPLNGSMAEACFWNVALSDAEIALLATGISPLLMRPASIVLYTPLIRGFQAVKGTTPWTETGTTTVADHCRIFPRKPFQFRQQYTTDITGTLAATEAADTAALSGGVLVSGTLAATEATDTAALSGKVDVAGTFAATEPTDTAAISATAFHSGALAATEAADAAAFSGKVDVAGTIAATEAQDVAALSGQVNVDGALAATEAADSAAISGQVDVAGALAATEPTDTAGISGRVDVAGSLAAMEAPDSAAFAGQVDVAGSLAAVEAPDIASLAAHVGTEGDLSTTEPADAAAITGQVDIAGSLSAAEAADAAAFSGAVVIAGAMAASEAPDLAEYLGQVDVDGFLDAMEAGDTASISAAIVIPPRKATQARAGGQQGFVARDGLQAETARDGAPGATTRTNRATGRRSNRQSRFTRRN